MTENGQNPPTIDSDFWNDLTEELSAVAAMFINTSNLNLGKDAEDFAQVAICETWVWFAAATRPDLPVGFRSPRPTRSHVRARARKTLNNDLLSAARDARNRERLLNEQSAASKEWEGTAGFVRARTDLPDELLVAADLVARIQELAAASGSPRYEKVAQVLKDRIEKMPADPSPTWLAATAGVTTKVVDDFRNMLRRNGVTPKDTEAQS